MSQLTSPARRNLLLATLAGAALLAGAGPLQAQAFPTKPITLVVPFPPGGGPDVAARVIGEKLSARLGQPVVVDNKPGAGALIGAAFVAKAAPDGHTLLLTPNTMAISPHVLAPGAGGGVDVYKDLTAVIAPATTPLILVANPQLGVKDLKGLVELAKKQPGLAYGSPGNGSPMHFAAEMLKKSAGVDLLHVPYKGDSPMAADLLGGQVDLAMLTVTAAVPHVAAKSFKMFASTGAKASPQLGGVRTIADLGYPGFEAELWYVLTAPAGTPEAIVQKLSDAVQTALKDAEVQRQFDQQALSPRVMDAPTVRRFIEAERMKWEETIRTANIKIDS